jgi:pyrroloquinoline-quinone synthase
MKSHLGAVLEFAIEDRKLLDHPFYRRWEAGELTRDELRLYAEQYRYFEEMFPRFLEELASELPEGIARDAVLKNLADETATPSHLDLYNLFAEFYQASVAPISVAMSRLVDTYFDLLAQGPSAALAGLWAYESQGAGIADSKAEGLAAHYGANNESLSFWRAHGTIEDDHAKWTLEALETIEPNDGEVRVAARLIANAWFSFLNERESLAA